MLKLIRCFACHIILEGLVGRKPPQFDRLLAKCGQEGNFCLRNRLGLWVRWAHRDDLRSDDCGLPLANNIR